MELLDLPEEILIMIVRKLDLITLMNVYETCTRLRNIVCVQNIIQHGHLSMNRTATVNTIMSLFFRSISSHLSTLNLSGVPDLFKTKLFAALRRLRRLKTLDITYTNLHMLDFVEIHEICPTIKNISINFAFGLPGQVTLPESAINQCQDVFEHMDNVHFVGSISNLLYSKLVLYVLQKAKLDTLKFSVAELDGVFTVITEYKNRFHLAIPLDIYDIPELNRFTVYILNWKSTSTYESVYRFPVLSAIEYHKYEFFIVYMINPIAYAVYATPVFKEFFEDNFGVTPTSVTDENRHLVGNVAIMLWNKETTTFNESFFQKLYKDLKQYFPKQYSTRSADMFTVQNNDWVCIVPEDARAAKEAREGIVYQDFKRRRIARPALKLDYNDAFETVDEVELSLIFNTHIARAVTLSYNGSYLRKLTFLNLCGQVTYHSEFFKVLFYTCKKLVTLSLEAPLTSPCSANIIKSIHMCKTIKNFRILDKRIDFTSLFAAFSQCNNLENVHVLDHRQWEHCEIPDPDAFVKACPNLYCVFVEAPLSEAAQTRLLKAFKKAKVKYDRHFIKIVVNQTSSPNVFQYNYNPFLDVFRLSAIKPTL
ncbi:unnamed protein product [Chrysodeixis includens]|uniref:F-box domain-containing protein n=1 Tax=Chrysodeixis includens TaxID=689277 RepID=A0A9P0FRY5_CHRIL|nr:unnamed protein product [Chrysodeixis includens]